MSTMKTEKATLSSEEINLVTLAREYSDEDKARELLESLRWPHGPVCPHCGNKGEKKIYTLTPKATSKSPGRKGLRKCGACRKQFTVMVNTIFSDSHIPIATWMMALFIMCSAKKSVSAHQLHRMLGIGYQAAWFMAHRIRFAFKTDSDQPKLSGTVECDELYVGPRTEPKYSQSSKVAVAALVQRDGVVRTQVFKSVTEKNMRQFIGDNASKSAILNTDEAGVYRGKFKDYKRHDTVCHKREEYARTNPDGSVAHVNNTESFFSLIRRGIVGSFHHVSAHHLHRYADEFAFRWSNRKMTDGQRTEVAIEMVEGKRLMYKDWSKPVA